MNSIHNYLVQTDFEVVHQVSVMTGRTLSLAAGTHQEALIDQAAVGGGSLGLQTGLLR